MLPIHTRTTSERLSNNFNPVILFLDSEMNVVLKASTFELAFSSSLDLAPSPTVGEAMLH